MVQELEEQVAVLRQDVERTRHLLTRERDNRINVTLPKRFQIREVRVLPLSHDLSGSGCQGGFAAMSQVDTAHAWWSRLRHQGMLLSPVVLVERYPSLPPTARFPLLDNLRNAYNRFVSSLADLKENADRDEATILKWVDALLEKYVECGQGQIAKQHDARINVTAPVRIGSRTETVRPHRVVFADATGTKIALLVMADTSPHVGRGRGRTAYAQFLELLRATGHRIGLLTNGSQFRLIYAGLDFEAWAEWESERWFDGGEGTEELNGLRQLLSPESVKPVKSGASGLLDAIEESRKRQADLSSVLRENVRQAVELIAGRRFHQPTAPSPTCSPRYLHPVPGDS